METDKEDKGDDEEPTAGAVPKWVAGQVTALHVKTPEEEEEERMLEEAEKAKAQLGKQKRFDIESSWGIVTFFLIVLSSQQLSRNTDKHD